MDINQRKFNSQIEITDLIEEAVKNASTRRNQVIDAQETLLELSEEEKRIMGGLSPGHGHTCGMIPCEPFEPL
jgi:hypothetical protein